jgi:hypothetical protein
MIRGLVAIATGPNWAYSQHDDGKVLPHPYRKNKAVFFDSVLRHDRCRNVSFQMVASFMQTTMLMRVHVSSFLGLRRFISV